MDGGQMNQMRLSQNSKLLQSKNFLLSALSVLTRKQQISIEE